MPRTTAIKVAQVRFACAQSNKITLHLGLDFSIQISSNFHIY